MNDERMTFTEMTKKEMYVDFSIFGRRNVMSEMNEAIATNRGITLEEAKKVKTLRIPEVKSVYIAFDRIPDSKINAV